MVAQALPVSGRRELEVSAASALADARASARRRRGAARTRRSSLAYADLVSAQTREAELARRATACVSSRTCSRSGRRRATRRDTTVCVPSAK